MNRPRLALLVIAVALLSMLATALVVGPGGVTPRDVLAVLTTPGVAERPPSIERTLVWDLRLPRALLVVLVGVALAMAGVVTQGLFRNPMAEPGVLGVSAGAAAAAVMGFALGLDQWGVWVSPLLAGAGALAILAVLLIIGRPAVGGFATLLLSGIALGALCSSMITLVLSLGTERWDLGLKVVRWLMGSFEGRSWTHVGVMLLTMALGVPLCGWLRLDLDALALGPTTAASLGVDVPRTQKIALLAVALLVGAATALTGVIGFVGLVVPHIARLWVGPQHRVLLPVSALLGGLLLLIVDTVSRSSSALALPPGAITSLIGAPFFLWLLRRHGESLA